ncbi:pyridoxal 5'-phosphate synthase [Streptomyces sp. NPDC046939]|uniref:pyridoxine/pyridoxamine 5'-phosphate oxidase n=1 Tax=Streptomyces sp. NPDC046939 TaxID=3155376 RepID=UPI0033D6B4A7
MEPTPDLRPLLKSLRVWDTELPVFDPATAPEAPLRLFAEWFAAAVAAGQSEPHTPTLATTDADGNPDARTVMLHGADARALHFASHADSAKGRQLAARPFAALHFYWPAQGRQVRLRGPVRTAPPEVAHADLHVRSTGALASALTGHQSAHLPSYDVLVRASEDAWARAEREPDAPVPSWTVYELLPREVEFFQGDARRRHVRLRYTEREDGAWAKELLWP